MPTYPTPPDARLGRPLPPPTIDALHDALKADADSIREALHDYGPDTAGLRVQRLTVLQNLLDGLETGQLLVALPEAGPVRYVVIHTAANYPHGYTHSELTRSLPSARAEVERVLTCVSRVAPRGAYVAALVPMPRAER